MSYNDMSLTCSRCDRTFVWTAYHQEWRASRGLMDVLTQCEKCRASGALERTANPAIVPAPPWDGLPMRTVTRKGVPGDPINLAFEGSQEALLAAFNTMGLLVADSLSLRSDLRIARAAVMHASYAAAPVSNLFLFDRPEDLAIEYELGSVARRHHARFWETGRPLSLTLFWTGIKWNTGKILFCCRLQKRREKSHPMADRWKSKQFLRSQA